MDTDIRQCPYLLMKYYIMPLYAIWMHNKKIIAVLMYVEAYNHLRWFESYLYVKKKTTEVR
jgi:hypothetical protein